MTPNSDDSVEVELKADGVRVVSSGRSVATLGSALVDALSPFTNALGVIGDRVHIARRVAVLKAAKKAKEQLAEEGISEGNVPPKILLPWIEGASLEVDDDETLQTAWAGLLARSVKSSDAANISYMEVLRKMGAKEAQLLQFFCQDTAPFFSSKFYDLNTVETFSRQNPLFGNIEKGLDKIESHDGYRNYFDNLGFQIMRQVIFYSLDEGRFTSTPFFDSSEVSVSNLEHLGVIKIKKGEFQTEKHRVSVVWFELTKFGFDMMWACQGKITGGEHEMFFRQGSNVE